MVKNCVIIVLLLLIIGETIYFFYQKKRQDKEIKDLIDYLSKVQDQLDLPEIDRMCEGRFGILQSEIYKVVVMLREAYAGEKRQRKYVVDMMSDISHQIKTPVTAITILAELLEASDVTEEQRLEYAEKIDKQTLKITWLIKNILTLSKLEADMLPLKKEEVDGATLAKKVIEPLLIMAEVKEVDLKVDVTPSIKLFCDQHWTVEALQNIVKNCIEHTPAKGCVTLAMKEDHLATRITILDTGEGMDSEDLPHIFDRFYKAKNAYAESVGIGLSMARQIILKQNGMIDVTSQKGEGTRFEIKLYKTDTV